MIDVAISALQSNSQVSYAFVELVNNHYDVLFVYCALYSVKFPVCICWSYMQLYPGPSDEQ